MKKPLFKLLKIFFLSIIAIGVFLIAILYFSLHKKMPEGTSGAKADQLATQILQAIQHDKFIHTEYISWTFRNKNKYVWNKKDATVEVTIDGYTTKLDLANHANSKITSPHTLTTKKEQDILQHALDSFHNDSFWVVAPHKLFDDGVHRKLVKLEDDKKGLLITYSTGGTTPGDSYLWKVDDNFVPTGYQMWVSIIPIGGLEASWEDWITTDSGTYLPQQHSLLGFGIPITDLKAWND